MRPANRRSRIKNDPSFSALVADFEFVAGQRGENIAFLLEIWQGGLDVDLQEDYSTLRCRARNNVARWN
jgi:hypothetical protein